MYIDGETAERGDEATRELRLSPFPFAASTVGCTSLGAGGSATAATDELFEAAETRGVCSGMAVFPQVNGAGRETGLASALAPGRVFWLRA